MKTENPPFAYYVSSFFTDYISRQRSLSPNTVKSYRDSIVLMLCYFDKELHIKPERLRFEDFTCANMEGFLDWLEETRGVSVSTRNQRLAAIHSLFKYIQYKDLFAFEQCKEVLAVPYKKTSAVPMNYLSLEEIRILFGLPNQKSKSGIRDLAMLVLLYETGARVQELIDLTPQAIQVRSSVAVELCGKGRKIRWVPLNNHAYTIVKTYLNQCHRTVPSAPLFVNKAGEKLTRAGVQYIIDKYIAMARQMNPGLFTNRITNHCFRHSKAMHLLEAGVNLIYIRDFLGHSTVTTTEIYAKTNPIIKEKVLLQDSASLETAKRFSAKTKEGLVEWLRNNL